MKKGFVFGSLIIISSMLFFKKANTFTQDLELDTHLST